MAKSCPYCGIDLTQEPKRTAKCKACKETIYVRSVEGESDKRLLTDVEADDFDADQADKKHDKKRASKLVHELLDENSIVKGSKPARIASAIAKYEKLTAWNEKRQIAYMLANCAHADNLNPHQWAVEAAICHLKQFATMPGWHDHLFVSNGCLSPICAALEGKKFTLEQALVEMPIPSPHCTNDRNSAGFARCQCTWMVDLDAVSLNSEATPPHSADKPVERQTVGATELDATAINRLTAIGITPPRLQRDKATNVRKKTSLYFNGFLLIASFLGICSIIYFAG